MPAYYRTEVSRLISESASTVVGELAIANGANERFSLTPESIDAWNSQLPPLQEALRQLVAAEGRAANWTVLLEYPIPRVGKRIDAVLLAHDAVLVLETKTGKSATSAERQVDDYAIHLACFHEPSADRKLVPIVVSDGPVSFGGRRPFEDPRIKNCVRTDSTNPGKTLVDVCAREVDWTRDAIDPKMFNEGRFKPIPPIMEAAVKLYGDMEVFEIGHSSSAQKVLEDATQALTDVVKFARTSNQKAVCFITGVPGAGKTLVGLNAVHHPEVRATGAFLSGNGPLVKIVREALIRDVTRRTGITRRKAELEVQAFIQSVHRFADDHYGPGAPTPSEQVIVFDEAQRAWDAKQNSRAGRPEVSEAHMMLDVLNRHEGWAVLVALIGGGQEINRGEAGIEEWGRALAGFPDWQIFAAPELIGNRRTDFHFVDPEDPIAQRIQRRSQFHLTVSNRSIRAKQVAAWVDALLMGTPDSAAVIAREMSEEPVLVRDLPVAREWLRSRQRGFTRSGLVASATASRLRSDGVETDFGFHQGYKWERWFLDRDVCDETNCNHKYCNDVRASSRLEVAATQFEIQGLELDWVGLCWGEDLLWQGGEWQSFNFNGKRWRRNTNPVKHRFRVNGYRVLLTRARQGLVIYVPRPTTRDRSRMHKELEETAEFLCAAGAKAIDR